MTQEQERELLRTLTVIKWTVGIMLGFVVGLWLLLSFSGCQESHHSHPAPLTRHGIQQQIKAGKRPALVNGWYVLER
jgi:hypothetical protein